MKSWLAVVVILVASICQGETAFRHIPLANADFSQDWDVEPPGGAPNGWSLFDFAGVGTQGVYRVSTVWDSDPGYGNCLELYSGNEASRVGIKQEIVLNQTFPYPVYLEAAVKLLCVAVKPGSYFGANLYAETEYMDGTREFANTPMDWGCGEWHIIGLNVHRSFPSFTPRPDPKPIRRIFLVLFLADAEGTARFDNVRVKEYTGRPAPAVTVMFDDAEQSTYHTALPILESYGIKSSLAVPVDDLGQPGHMSIAEMQDYVRRGNTVQSHGFLNELGAGMGPNGEDMGFNIYSPAEARPVLKGSREKLQGYLNQAGIPFTVRHMVFPYGAYRMPLLSATQDYYVSGRLAEQVSNPIGSYRWTIGVRSLTFDTPMSDVDWWLDETVRRNNWTILLFHGIKESDSDRFYNTPAQLRAILDKVRAKGLRTIKYEEGIEEFAAMPSGGEYGDHPNPE